MSTYYKSKPWYEFVARMTAAKGGHCELCPETEGLHPKPITYNAGRSPHTYQSQEIILLCSCCWGWMDRVKESIFHGLVPLGGDALTDLACLAEAIKMFAGMKTGNTARPNKDRIFRDPADPNNILMALTYDYAAETVAKLWPEILFDAHNRAEEKLKVLRDQSRRQLG